MRLYSKKQKTALAARDGGCMWPGCDRPPSWTEAHHVDHHHKGGKTTIENGILLCRFHHLLLHNNHWNITRDLFGWWLVPPVDVDPLQVPRPMPTKSLAFQDLERHRDSRRENSACDAEGAARQPENSARDAEEAERARQAEISEDAHQEELAELMMLTLLADLERTPLHGTR